ncbi:uncharacterized protein LOC120277933 [Dioscorea cayenensis subsp. rotundata]|uniref:Uncharacterized protein LOC120277933 n=1 Tax=Dioscorea cayennensis subsp. rotundata TaxID=55577 RepID=A0AB40CL23_DIOCR|nr:uncharacterized protein LOC120277933 [Dioscorea cayenensis subsp. rotundata]
MRLLQLVPCSGWRDMAPEDSPEEPPMAPMVSAIRVSRGKRRRSSSKSSTSWRPSLGSISEDGVAVKMAVASAAASSGKVGERARMSRSVARVPANRERDDYRNYGAPAIVPAFSPTAFLF